MKKSLANMKKTRARALKRKIPKRDSRKLFARNSDQAVTLTLSVRCPVACAACAFMSNKQTDQKMPLKARQQQTEYVEGPPVADSARHRSQERAAARALALLGQERGCV